MTTNNTPLSNEAYTDLMKDQIMHYSPYYFEFYTRSMAAGKISFDDHITNIVNPDREFLEGIFFADMRVMFDRFSEDGLDKNIGLDAQEEQYDKTLASIKEDFMAGLKEFYLDGINQMIDNVAEELKFAKEDEQFYINREYVGKEEEFGGPINEAERLTLISKEAEKQEKFAKKLEYLKGIRQEIAEYK